ncbi:flagellin [Brachyspira hyodysenteriae]|uniref:Flagellin n=1 Tax=Brachyspira intermedia (strain ATCC 51140 / PWS/A) TaxID=1045858 RepID=G0EIL9_BRAIP|nr:MULTISPECIES: flagellin [Brachyspira]AEM21027.1 periplasmic flagellar filament protein FlaB3 [Brachyspira intermedia PWS/A]MCZ9839178.1 flagellin [Brachyspira hyodysenteriae]MCZ9847797.1 flagellin [Brachyspira hyodysenteriae]MCZ9851362.1 flagellin [Brachyspira hyodysenteriae]MCZ9859911.1 flagellin [Brachyspira hyodysenteriae]
MIINNNISALNANRQLNLTGNSMTKTIAQLSSGMRINTAGDDASGLAVSEKMRSQYRGLQQATRNAQNGISFIQTTEGYLNETTNIMQRMRELAIQSANGIYSDSDRALIQVEVNQLVAEVDRIASQAEFNKMNMLTGRFAADGQTPMTFHIGANMDQRVSVNIGSMTAANLQVGGDTPISISSVETANQALGRIDEGIQMVVAQRAELGAVQNRMESMVKSLMIATENTIASESVIRDADMASAMVAYTREQILQQTGAAMLANANMKNQSIMRIIG